ncbi:hypothetical protein OH76DRAFT_105445 [Lentinus brumalis]|uniref:Uncharacterized protein n=1 Tax=Lentinus brumalis TaxID=2498619 RepID=A0A371CQ99_9APHY|nr:hypothetical protein OH76DRAFT_105445 [Polyporus brumalis]
MDPEFAEAFARSQGFVDVSAAASAPSLGTSMVKIAREKARDAVHASVQYFTERLPPTSTYMVEDKHIRVENGEIRVRCLVPISNDQSATFPVMVWFHGGGWIVGDLDQDDAFLRGLSCDGAGRRRGDEKQRSRDVREQRKGARTGVDSAGIQN